MNPREQWIMAALAAAAALYVFGWKALVLLAIAGLIYYVLRTRT